MHGIVTIVRREGQTLSVSFIAATGQRIAVKLESGGLSDAQAVEQARTIMVRFLEAIAHQSASATHDAAILEEQLQEGLKDTFSASDSVSVTITSGTVKR